MVSLEQLGQQRPVRLVGIDRSHKDESIGGVSDVGDSLTVANFLREVWLRLCNARTFRLRLVTFDGS